MSTIYLPGQAQWVNRRLSAGVTGRTFVALMCCFAFASWLVESDPRFQHWFVIPVVICGALIGSDAVGFLQGRLEVMDPSAILGLLGVHFFFLAPLLHVLWDAWVPYVVGPADWRDWLGWMATLNVAGLVLYRVARSLEPTKARALACRAVWKLDTHKTVIVLTTLLLVTGLTQIWVYIHFGGISGYIDTYLYGERHYGTKDAGVGFNGMGWIFMISESFPVLALFGFCAYLHEKGKRPGWLSLSVILATYFALVMLFGGLRGSRSNTIWALFWAVGALHFWVRKITRGFLLVGVMFLIAFMYLYGFYKSVGTEALDAFQGADTRDALAHKTGRTFQGAILGDLGRSDVQAFALYKMTSPPVVYEYAWGLTYVGAVSILIPRPVWPDRPPDKVRWVTELEYGPGSYQLGIWQSSHVYGLAGEAMLNFGPVSVPFVYLVLGFIVSGVRLWMRGLAPEDSRWLMAPLAVMFTFLVMANDADVNVFFLIKYGSVPFLAVFLSSRRMVSATINCF